MPLSPLQETPRDVPCKTRGQDGFATSFPVGLLHPLQHAGLSRRSPVCPSSAQIRTSIGFSSFQEQIPDSSSERVGSTVLVCWGLSHEILIEPGDCAADGVNLVLTFYEAVTLDRK